ncbi:hypothetical protein DXG01_013182, partial [Tephrocybe rancida]
ELQRQHAALSVKNAGKQAARRDRSVQKQRPLLVLLVVQLETLLACGFKLHRLSESEQEGHKLNMDREALLNVWKQVMATVHQKLAKVRSEGIESGALGPPDHVVSNGLSVRPGHKGPIQFTTTDVKQQLLDELLEDMNVTRVASFQHRKYPSICKDNSS